MNKGIQVSTFARAATSGNNMITCIVCTRKIAKHQQGHSIKGLPAHRKCMIAYTAWEVEQEHPGASAGESRILQVRRNLENLFIQIG